MTTTTYSRVVLALAVLAAPLSAQIDVRRPDHGRDRSRTTTTSDGTVLGGVLGGTTRSTDRIPPGHLPPRGMCRVWIDGVPPGQQPPVTDCATAQRDAYGRANAHVIYGDERSFPGKGKGKFKKSRGGYGSSRTTSQSCSVWDVVVVGGQQVPVCRDRTQQGSVLDRRSRDRDDELDDDDEREERDARFDRSRRGERSEHHGKSKRGKGHGDD